MVERVQRAEDSVVLDVRPGRIATGELAIGDSLCHDGACLTVTTKTATTYSVLCGAETLARTSLGDVREGSRLNLERALRVGDRLGGHWVTGHVDGTGELVERVDNGANLVLRVRAPRELLRYVVEKGSIALCGVSLTVNAVDEDTFAVALIPHTVDHTNLGDLAVGGRVNLEVDILAKHVEKLLPSRSASLRRERGTT